jgi:biotin carboxyl carrier protein
MPGTVLEVLVSPGDAVSAGQVLVLIEAMKMELAVHSPADGTVSAVHVSGGELVRAGQPLAEVE